MTDDAPTATPPMTMREQMARAMLKSDNDAGIRLLEAMPHPNSAMLAYLRTITWENCSTVVRKRCYRRVDTVLDVLTKPPTEHMVDKGAHAASEWLDDRAPLREHTYREPVKSIWHDMVEAMIQEGKPR